MKILPARNLAWVLTASCPLLLSACSLSAHWSWGHTSTPEKAAEDVLARVPLQGITAAYVATSPQFRQFVGANAWKALAEGFDLKNYQGVDWQDNTKESDAVTRLKGVLLLHGELGVPIDVQMTREHVTGFWKVSALRMHRTNALTVGEGAQGTGAPAGTALVNGDQFAASCRTFLSHIVAFDTVTCMDTVPAQVGASSLCAGATRDHITGITATITSYDPTIQDVGISCRITDPLPSQTAPAPAASAPAPEPSTI